MDICVENFHAEGARPVGYSPADATHAEDAKIFTGELPAQEFRGAGSRHSPFRRSA